MNLKIKLSRFSFLCIFGLSLAVGLGAAEEEVKLGTGLKIPTKEEFKELEKLPKIRKVRPNKIGKARSKHRSKVETSELSSKQPEVVFGESLSDLTSASEPSALPSYVDNSTLPCFPRIGDQGPSGACTAFATTYYQATHEIGLLNGYNNKVSLANVLSPRWTYNMINGGYDNGSKPLDAYRLLEANGAAPNVNFPFTVLDPYGWDLNPNDWIVALSYRTAPVVQVPGIGGASQDLTQIKQLLANGHVLTFGTYAGGWKYTTIKNNPNPDADNRFVGQSAIHYTVGIAGAHFVTIVGYNDNLWVDVNGNGQVDPGEMGAFLIANSWGTGWKNRGFIWISYDAFLNISKVANGPLLSRTAAAATLNNIVFSLAGKAVNYKPSLIAQFTLNSGRRNQFGVSTGISSPSQMSPASVLTSGALNYQGGIRGFDGTQTEGAATFALDLTDLAVSNPADFTRFYLITRDNLVGYPTTLTSFKLIDNIRNTTTDYAFLPRVIDNKTVGVYLDAILPPPPPPMPVVSPVISITSPQQQSRASGLLAVSTQVTVGSLPIASVTLYVDNTPISIDLQGPYTFLLDTTTLSNGGHTLLVKATDTEGNFGEKSVLIFVSN